MNYDSIQDYCLQKPGAEEDYKTKSDVIRFIVHGKMFALIGRDPYGRLVISVKHTPERGEELREKYAGIFPGYGMKKKHWSSAMLNGEVPDDVLKEMVDESHRLILALMSTKVQKEILTGPTEKKPVYDDDDDD